jgi:phage gp36-like protein
MTPLLSVTELEGMLPRSAVLPLDEAGSLDSARILAALDVATGEIVAYLPWLLDSTTGEVVLPLPAQFSGALRGVCADIALLRLTDAVTSREDDAKRHDQSVALLKTIAAEHQGGLLGPDLQAASIVEPSDAEGIIDRRFFKKGELV